MKRVTSSVTRRMTASDRLPEGLFDRLNGRNRSVEVHERDGAALMLALFIGIDL